MISPTDHSCSLGFQSACACDSSAASARTSSGTASSSSQSCATGVGRGIGAPCASEVNSETSIPLNLRPPPWDAGHMSSTDRRSLARAAWNTRSSRPIYENEWMRVREDIAEMPDGRTTTYGVVECNPAIGILPFLDPDTVVLVGQYRYVARDFYWEIPTGGIRRGESHETAAQRELS